MSEPRLISPMLDNFLMGGPISDHHGVCCCPAMENGTDDRYIVKVISVPASSTQMDALLLSGAYPNEEAALNYYRGIVDEIIEEVNVLEKLSELECFVPYQAVQMVPMESGRGYEIYLLGTYKRTLQKHFSRHIFTHLDALNLGLDLCSALTLCRRSGYMYVNLKPSNVFVADLRLFRIGDLGFVGLDSLKYASLPERYQSVYTPPEVRDAFSALNTTMDIYAAGLILYQAYNNGELPFNDEIKPGDPLPAPLYADYEIGEIILKACAVNPDDRWQEPAEMRQAIINYMQRNGALDIPIVPMPTAVDEPEIDAAQTVADAEDVAADGDCAENSETEEITPTSECDDSQQEAEAEENIPEADAAEIDISEETETVESDEYIEEALLEEEDIPFEEKKLDDYPEGYAQITDEVSDMLNQAEELANLDVPEPVVVPEHVDIPEPDPITVEEPEVEEEEPADESPVEEIGEVPAEDDSDVEFNEGVEAAANLIAPLKRIHWVRNFIILLTVAVLLVGGIYFYKNHYLLPIEFITVEGNEDTLTVIITTEIDESILEVVCSDTYGNRITAKVIDGKAEFSGLVPNTAYSIKVNAKGFHRLTGNASTAYSTPIQTNIVQFDAIAGSTEDSVILSFTAEGPSCEEWSVQYFADGIAPQSATFVNSQMVTITNLTVGKEYTFRLVPKQALYLTGQTEIKFTPDKLIRAENLYVTSCMDNKLTVSWSAPQGVSVSGWSVRCHNDTYNQTIVTTDTTVTFENLDHAAEFDIEVKAIGMSVSTTATVPANSVTAYDFIIDTSNPKEFALSWNASKPTPEEGWTLCYSIQGMSSEEKIVCKENKAVIAPLIPNAVYKIRIEDVNGAVLFGSQVEITAGDAQEFTMEFSRFTLKAEELSFNMCKTPARPNWGRYDLSDDDYTNKFAVGQSASFLVRAQKDCYISSESCNTMFVIRDQNGNVIMSSQQTKTWTDMWKNYNCKLEITAMPTEVGTYTIEVYFNGGLAHQQEFIIQ